MAALALSLQGHNWIGCDLSPFRHLGWTATTFCTPSVVRLQSPYQGITQPEITPSSGLILLLPSNLLQDWQGKVRSEIYAVIVWPSFSNFLPVVIHIVHSEPSVCFWMRNSNSFISFLTAEEFCLDYKCISHSLPPTLHFYTYSYLPLSQEKQTQCKVQFYWGKKIRLASTHLDS